MATVINLDIANTGSPPTHGSHAVSIASFNRTADTTLYTSNDVVSSDATPRSLVFPGCGGSGTLLNAQLVVEENDAQTFELYLFNEEPGTGFADNAQIALAAADVPKLVMLYAFAAANAVVLSTVGDGIICYPPDLSEATSKPHAYVTADGKNLYGLLVVKSAWTPAVSGAKIHIRLGLRRD